jgi:hypothetical protein
LPCPTAPRQAISFKTLVCLHGGCDVIWSVNRRLDDGLSSKIESLTEPAKKALEEAVDYIFKNDLDPFLSRVDSLVEQRFTQIDKIFQDAITKAETATANTISRVKYEIILTASTEIKKIADEVLNDVKCGATFTEEEAQRFLDKNIKSFFEWPFKTCGPVDRDNYFSVYLGRKCQYDIDLSDRKTIEDLRNEYLEYLDFGSKFLCLVRDDRAKNEIMNAPAGQT